LLDIVVGPDRHRLDLLLGSDHVFQRRAELDGEPPMRHENKTDHGIACGHFLVAPHERAHILTIRSPRARGFSVNIRAMLHCGNPMSDPMPDQAQIDVMTRES